MRIVAGQFRELSRDDLVFAKAIGCDGIGINKPDFDSPAWVSFLGKTFTAAAGPRAPTRRWSALDLLAIRTAVEAHGLTLDVVEGVPRNLLDRVMLGLPGAEEQVEDFKATIRAMGQAGIPTLGYNWIPDGVWRTARKDPGRGGAEVVGYDHALGAGVSAGSLPARDAEAMWANWERFITEVLPVAEASGVKLSLHPNDPPVPVLDGVARLFVSEEAFARAMTFADSPYHGVCFCVGTFASISADAMFRAMERFGRAGRIHYVHFRNVRGALPRFSESFVDDGSVDVVRAMRLLRDVGFDGVVMDDHVPHLPGDTVWGHRARAHATGYIAGLARMLQAVPQEAA